MKLPRPKARAMKRRVPGTMTKTEERYRNHLQSRLVIGEIASYEFEPEKLRLAKDTSYTPDFRVILPDGTIEFHEVKSSAGYRAMNNGTSRVKIKVAAEMHWMYRFVSAVEMKKQAGWNLEVIDGE